MRSYIIYPNVVRMLVNVFWYVTQKYFEKLKTLH